MLPMPIYGIYSGHIYYFWCKWNKTKIHQALEKVCNSEIIEKPPQNIKILEFLVDQALKN